MSSWTTKGRVVKTKTISTGSLTYVYLHDCGCWVVPAGASIPQPTRSTRAKEAHRDFSVKLPANARSTRQKETSGDHSFGLSDSGEESPVKNGEFSGLFVCAWGFIPFNVQCLPRVLVPCPVWLLRGGLWRQRSLQVLCDLCVPTWSRMLSCFCRC